MRLSREFEMTLRSNSAQPNCEALDPGKKSEKRRPCPEQRHFADAPNLFAKQSEKQAACLFSGQDRILHCFSNAEFQRGFRGNLDSLSGGRVAAFARFPV